MSHRAVILTVALLGAGTVGLTLSCSAPDPGEVTFIERSHAGDTQSSSGDTSSSSSSTSSSSSSTSSTSSTSSSSSSGTPTDAFAGAPAFGAPATNPNTSNQNAHGTNPNPAGRDCLSCHNAANGNAPIWSFAGTVYDTAGNAVAGAEVRAIDKTGKASKLIYTDALGNFWCDDTTFVPLKVGVRNATKMMQMGTLLDATKNDQSCQRSTCHNSPGGQAKISL